MIQQEVHGDIALLRLAHGKASALDLELCDALTDELSALADAGPAALVLTGTGSIFSAGVDLFRVLEGGAEYAEAFVPSLSRTRSSSPSRCRPRRQRWPRQRSGGTRRAAPQAPMMRPAWP